MTSAAAPKKRILAGQYEVLEIVGRGASSVVYRAKYLDKDSELAIKVLLTKEELGTAANRLRKEALAMVAARHKYVLRLDDFHSYETLHYLTMEYAPYSDLRNFMHSIGRTISAAEAERYLQQIAEALSFVHNVGIIHRDIKPDNILVINDRQVRLGDFSASLLPGETSSLEELQRGIGSLDYLAPEVLRAESYGTFSDIYSLGVTFYECITGINPLSSVPMAEMLSAREEENFNSLLTYCPDLKRSVAKIILKCLSYDPKDRFQSGSELLKAIEESNNSLDFSAPKSIPLTPADEDFTPNFEEDLDSPENVFDFPTQTSNATQTDSYSEDLEGAHTEKFEDEPKSFAPTSNANLTENDENNSIQDEYHPHNDPYFVDLVEHAQDSAPVEDKNFFTQKVQSDSEVFVYKKQAQGNANTKTQAINNKGKILPLIIVALGIIIAFKVITAFFGGNSLGSNQGFLPSFSGSKISFPDLPPGSYLGKITNLTPDSDTSMIAISSPEFDEITILFGIEGFSPYTFSTESLPRDSNGNLLNSLLIKEHGYLLELQIDSIGNSIKGNYVNLLNNEKGYWELQPKL